MSTEWAPFTGAAFLLLALTPATGGEQAITISRSGSRPSSPGSAQYFTGSVSIEPLVAATDPSRVTAASVTFEPGARTAWHTHPLGQTLIVTAGAGRVQRWGDPVQEILPGDVVRIPPSQKHWHGASPSSAMTHLAIQESLGGKNVDWLEPVSAAQYGGTASEVDLGVRDRFVGAWRLVWLEEEGADGTLRKPDCTGMLVFTRQGRMSVQVQYADPQAGNAGGPVQYAQGGYEASFGRFEVDADAGSFSYHVEGALVRALVGKDLKRRFELSGSQLIVTSANPSERWRVAWEHY